MENSADINKQNASNDTEKRFNPNEVIKFIEPKRVEELNEKQPDNYEKKAKSKFIWTISLIFSVIILIIVIKIYTDQKKMNMWIDLVSELECVTFKMNLTQKNEEINKKSVNIGDLYLNRIELMNQVTEQLKPIINKYRLISEVGFNKEMAKIAQKGLFWDKNFTNKVFKKMDEKECKRADNKRLP